MSAPQKRGGSGGKPPRGVRFGEGQKGNPGGRPAIPPEVKEAARAHTMGALETLVRVMAMSDEQPAPAVAAAKALLDRAWGTPQQSVDVKAEGGGALVVNIITEGVKTE